MNIRLRLLMAMIFLQNLISVFRYQDYPVVPLVLTVLICATILALLIIDQSNLGVFKIGTRISLNALITLLSLEHIFQEHFSIIINYYLILSIVLFQREIFVESNNIKNFWKFMQLISLYICIRFIAQFYQDWRIVVFITVQQPFVHYLIQQYYFIKHEQPFQSELADDQNPIRPKKISFLPSPASMQINSCHDDMFNMLPFGILLMDSNLKLIKHNQKAEHYLQTQDNLILALNNLIERQISQCKITNPIQQYEYPTCIKKKIVIQQLFRSQIKVNLESFLKKRRFTKQKGSRILHRQSVQFPSPMNSQQLQSQQELQQIQQLMNEIRQKRTSSYQNMTFQSDQMNISQTKVFVKQSYKTRIRILLIRMIEIESNSTYVITLENSTNKETIRLLKNQNNFQQRLINSFSHELKTPINCTLQLLQALQLEIGEELLKEYVKPALISTQKLMFQINDILDYALFECSDFKLKLEQFRLQDLISSISGYFQQECDQKNIKLDTNIDEDIDLIYNDQERILQILINLINNSVKFTSQNGSITINVQKASGDKIQISVWDNGKGMNSDFIEQIFEPYGVEGNKLGLGLKISNKIASKLSIGGQLKIQSREGFYTNVSFAVENYQKFELRMNLENLKDGEIFEESVEKMDQTGIQQVYSSKKAKQLIKCDCVQLLLVDDVPFNHFAFQKLLGNLGLPCDSAYDGDQAIQKVQQKLQSKCCKVYRVIFMDIEMPGKDGFETSRDIGNILDALNKRNECSLVMCSAYGSQENDEEAKRMGMKISIPKPVQLSRLKAMLADLHILK